MELNESDRAWLAALPKVELHLHLEGAIPLPTLWTLAEKYGGDPATPSLEALQARFAYRDFAHFIDTWVWKNRFLREAEDFTLAAEAVARHLSAQGHVYVEAFCSPPDFAASGLEPQEILGALRRGLDRVPQLRVALVPDLVRDFGPRRAARTLAQVAECADLGVIGIGLGGSEADFPPALFTEVFAEARRRGLRTSCHAGEAAGADSVRQALELLQVDRIGHATRAVEDRGLVDELVRRGTGLELCPLSNVRTGVIPSLAEHPIRRYLELGARLSVNTDDPAMFHTSLAGEYGALMELFCLDRAAIRALVESAIAISWLPDAEQALLRTRCLGPDRPAGAASPLD
jgi:adenosine deaminase